MRATYRRHLEQEAAETERDPFAPPRVTLSGDWWRDRKAIASENAGASLTADAMVAFKRQRRDRLARELAVLLEGAVRKDPKIVGEALAVALGKDRVAAVMRAAAAVVAT